VAGRLPYLFEAGARFRRFPELDGFRGCAVLLVIVSHTIGFRHWRGNRLEFGGLGVLCFFVLSGFLITGLLCAEERRSKTISVKHFYFRRAFRILPAALVYLATITVLKLVGLVTDLSWRAIVYAALFVANNTGGGVSVNQFWTLSLEEQFYLVWPLLFVLLGRRRLFAPALGVIVAVWVYRAVAISLAPWDYGMGIFEHRTDFRIDSILAGCALALFIDRRPADSRFASVARWGTHSALLIPALLLWTVCCERTPFLPVHLTVQTVLVCCLLFQATRFPNSVLGAVLRNPLLRFAGLVSYSLYLWNELFLCTRLPDWGVIRRLPLSLVISVVVAVLSYFFVERPFLRMKRRLVPEGATQ
jgi:peptidoglycan/LPS O-acetylase OafA/YrhL